MLNRKFSESGNRKPVGLENQIFICGWPILQIVTSDVKDGEPLRVSATLKNYVTGLCILLEATVGNSRRWVYRQSCQVIQSSLYCRRDRWWRWQVSALGLEAVFVCHVGKPNLLAVRWGVRRRTLCHLSLGLGVSRVLQKSALLGYNAICSLKATTRIVPTFWLPDAN